MEPNPLNDAFHHPSHHVHRLKASKNHRTLRSQSRRHCTLVRNLCEEPEPCSTSYHQLPLLTQHQENSYHNPQKGLIFYTVTPLHRIYFSNFYHVLSFKRGDRLRLTVTSPSDLMTLVSFTSHVCAYCNHIFSMNPIRHQEKSPSSLKLKNSSLFTKTTYRNLLFQSHFRHFLLVATPRLSSR